MGFVVDKAALGEVSSRVFRVFLVNIIPKWLLKFTYHLRDKQYARWWPQFRDIVSPYQHEKQQA
jgi:hypothetical protein